MRDIVWYQAYSIIPHNMKLDRTGCNRVVILTKSYAFKFPNFLDKNYRWYGLLRGLMSNMHERTWWYSTKWKTLCPIVFSIPGGFLNVMPRARILTDEEYLNNYDTLSNHMTYPCEPKSNSFGWIDDRIVTIDYGD